MNHITIYNLVMIHIIINNFNKIQLTINDHRCLLAFAKKQDFEDRPGSRSVLWWNVLLGGDRRGAPVLERTVCQEIQVFERGQSIAFKTTLWSTKNSATMRCDQRTR